MRTRVSLRLVGSATGKLAAAPDTLGELLEVATEKLQLSSPATRVFASSGDEIDNDDVQLIREGEVLYVSSGEDFRPPAELLAAVAADAPDEPHATVVEQAQPVVVVGTRLPLTHAAGGERGTVGAAAGTVAGAAPLECAAPSPREEDAEREERELAYLLGASPAAPAVSGALGATRVVEASVGDRLSTSLHGTSLTAHALAARGAGQQNVLASELLGLGIVHSLARAATSGLGFLRDAVTPDDPPARHEGPQDGSSSAEQNRERQLPSARGPPHVAHIRVPGI